MPGASDNVVTITIQTVDASSGAIANVETKLTGLGTTGTAATAKMATMAPALEHAGAAGATFASNATGATAAAGAGFDHVRSRIDAARLAAEEMGIRVPRAMLRVVAGNEAIMAGLQSMMGLFVAVGAVAIFTQMAEGVYHLYERWFDVTKAVEAYQDKAREAASQKLLETASIEETIALLKQAQNAVNDFEKQRTAAHIGQMPGAGLLQYTAEYQGIMALMSGASGGKFAAPGLYSAADDTNAAKAQATADRAAERQRKLDDEYQMGRLKGQAAFDSAADQGYAKIASHERDALAEANLRAQQEQTNAKALAEKSGQFYDPKSGEAQRLAAVAVIEQEAAGQRTALARTEQQTIITAQSEATNAHLVGIALVQSQEEQSIDAVLLKYRNAEISKQGLYAVSAAIWEKFEAQKLLKLQEEQRLVDAAFAHAGQVGDTGTRAIRNEQVDKIAAIPVGTDPEKAVGLRVAYEQEGDNKVLEAHEKFAEEMAQIDQRADDAMLGGYARIDAQAQRLIASAQKSFTEANKRTDLENPADYAKYAADYQAEQNAETGILANAQRERVAYTQKTDEEIAHTEAEAARAYLPAWQAAQERIEDDYTQRLAKIKADVDQHVLTEQQGARAATAAWQLANGEMERQQQATRDRLAGELSSLFDNPAKYMEDRAKKLMFDILANWMMQLTEAKGPMGSTMAWIFGMNPEMSTSTNPKTALGSIFGSHGATHGAAGAAGSSTLSAAGSTLSTAGSTLNAAGTTLSSSGTMLASAAQSLTSAAMHVESLTSGAGAGAGSGFGGGGLTPGGGTGDFTDMFGSGGTGALGGGGFQPSDINPAPTGATGVMGAVPGMASAIGGPAAGTVGQGSSLFGTLASGGVFGSGVQNFMSGGTGAAPMLNPNGVPGVAGGFQPTDIAPTNDAGVMGTPPSDSSSSGSSFGLAQGMGIGMAGIGAGMTIAQNWGNPNIGSAVLNDAMAGASLGTAIMPGIGTVIGAIGGAILGLFGSLFGDHGASQMRKYNDEQVVPAITKEMVSYTAAQVGYDQGLQDMQMLEMKADAQAKQWGSGAVGVYQRKVVPEIAAAIAEMERQQNSDRSGAISMQAAQYDSGGVIRHFGDLSTGPNSGYIHAQVGERMMDRMTNMRHSSTLDAISRGADVPRGNGTGLGGGGNGGGESHLHVHIHALDVQDFSRFLRSGGAQEIQSHLNANANRYAGKALGA